MTLPTTYPGEYTWCPICDDNGFFMPTVAPSGSVPPRWCQDGEHWSREGGHFVIRHEERHLYDKHYDLE